MQQQYFHNQQPKQYELPDYTLAPQALIRRLAGLDLATFKLTSELEIRNYSCQDIAFVILREVSAVLRDEYATLFDSTNAADPTAFFQSVAGLRERLTNRCNARLQQIVDSRLPQVPCYAVSERKILDLTDNLLPPKRGYILEACKGNTAPLEVQIDVKVTKLAPGEQLKVPHATKLNVWGPGQTIRWLRSNIPPKAGTLADAIVMPSKLKAVSAAQPRSMFFWRRSK